MKSKKRVRKTRAQNMITQSKRSIILLKNKKERLYETIGRTYPVDGGFLDYSQEEYRTVMIYIIDERIAEHKKIIKNKGKRVGGGVNGSI